MKFNKLVEEQSFCPLSGATTLDKRVEMYRIVNNSPPTREDFLSDMELGTVRYNSTDEDICKFSGLSFYDNKKSVKSMIQYQSKNVQKNSDLYICKVTLNEGDVTWKNTPTAKSNSHWTIWPSETVNLLDRVDKVEERNFKRSKNK